MTGVEPNPPLFIPSPLSSSAGVLCFSHSEQRQVKAALLKGEPFCGSGCGQREPRFGGLPEDDMVEGQVSDSMTTVEETLPETMEKPAYGTVWHV